MSPRQTRPKMDVASFRMPVVALDRLKAYAATQGINHTEIMRDVVMAYVEEHCPDLPDD